jgi:ferric-dicitrate binding protein FerR (iron transport regulator)
MGWRNCIVLMSGICLLADFVSAPASAQTRVGEAAVIKNQVHRVAGSAASQINVGDSAARLVMADSTNLSLGPNATITLDRTVFNDEHSYREIAIRLATGAFRFVTGHSAKTAYKITTSLATIGVRGTILDIRSQSVLGNGQGTQPTQGLPSKQVIVVLQEGAARVCTLGGQCVELTERGQTAIITSTGGKVTIQKTNSPPWTFASNCGAAAGLCTVTNFADATPPGDGSDPTGMLCGR